MFKNVAGQQIVLLAIDTATNTPKTGDAANITAYLSKDYGTVTVLGDTTATEMDATNAPGLYKFDVTQTESNCDVAVFSGKSSTSGIRIVPVTVFMRPANATALSIDSSGRVDVIKVNGTSQTARDLGGQLDATVSSRMATYTQPTGFLAATFPTTVASTTNITAGTITTVTNLTNNNDKTGYTLLTSPPTASAIATAVWQDTTAGDFTVASSIGKSLYTSGNAPGAASGLALVGSNMGTITGGTITTVSDKTGYSLSSSGLASVTTWTVGITGNITGNLSGSVGSVSGAVGSVATGGITSTSLATDAISAASVSAAAVTKIQSGLSTYAGGDTAGTTTLLSRITATRAGYIDNLSGGAVMLASSYTAPPSAASVATQVWTDLVSGSDFSTVGSAGKLLKDNIDATVSSRFASASYSAPPSAATISTQVQTDLGTGSALTSLASQSSVNTLAAYVDTEVAAILDAVSSSGVVLSAAQMNKIADHVHRRNMANVEASSSGDTLSLSSQYGAIQQAQESSLSGLTMTVKKTDGSTTLGTKTVVTSSSANPITGIS